MAVNSWMVEQARSLPVFEGVQWCFVNGVAHLITLGIMYLCLVAPVCLYKLMLLQHKMSEWTQNETDTQQLFTQ